MDRLSAVAAGAVLVWQLACDEPHAADAVKAPGRVDAVLASAKKTRLSDLCDVAPEPAQAFSWPELETAAAPQAGTRYRWVNVWATWCKPCTEELPLLAQSFSAWKQHNQAVTLTLVSIDSDPRAAQEFVAARPELPHSLAFKDPGAASSWLGTVGLSEGSAIPVHLILDAEDKLVCARSGGISARESERFGRALFP